ncbi:hypothetical protein [Dyella jiangningensis]
MAKKVSPRTARTDAEVCSLRRDNVTYGDFWMLVTGDEVTIAHQEPGEKAHGVVTMDKATFNRMLAFYNKPTQTPLKKWRLP